MFYSEIVLFAPAITPVNTKADETAMHADTGNVEKRGEWIWLMSSLKMKCCKILLNTSTGNFPDGP